MKSLSRILITWIILSLAAGCAGSGAAPRPTLRPVPAYWPTDGWRTSAPEEQGVDSELLTRMFEHIEQAGVNVRSVLIVRNGYLVTEAYFHPYRPDTYHAIASVTKSIVGMLVGIAIDQAYIKDVEQRLLDFYPGRAVAHLDERKRAITLEHLLTLTASFECSDAPGSGGPTMEQSENWVAFMLDLPMSGAPGTRFNYCSGAAHLLSAVLQQTTGRSTREFANEHLFQPLGIAMIPPDRWDSDPQGISTGGWGLYLVPRDMAKLGFLYLHGGRWADRQIVPADWVAASTTQHASKAEGIGYGYLWTVYPSEGRYAALGLGGQQIHVVPGLNLVVVFTSGLPLNDVGESPALNDLLREYILPAARSSAPLPANPTAAARLEDRIRAAVQTEQPVPPLPEIARSISGKTCVFEHDPTGFRTLALTFKDGQPFAVASVNGAPGVAIGLDNVYRITESLSGAPVEAVRGHWASDDTFVVEETRLGEIVAYEFHLTFSGENVSLTIRDKVFGAGPFTVYGACRQ